MMSPYEAHKVLEEVQACLSYQSEQAAKSELQWQLLSNMVVEARKVGTVEGWKAVGDFILGPAREPIPSWYEQRAKERDEKKDDGKG